ncbi:MAG: hypothetical protein Q9168_003914 [Polycauliona sp. 1 TL-2023]
MGGPGRLMILGHCLDNRRVTFADNKTWRLTKKIAGKPWQGSEPSVRLKEQDWAPCEEHAVYECVQTRGPNVGTKAIVKVRVEVPYHLPPSDDPKQRAKEASGMRLNGWTTSEYETLEKLTAAGCSVTPSFLGVKIDVQDKTILAFKSAGDDDRWPRDRNWWLPGGYIVYILMNKLPAQPLEYNAFWNDKVFTRQDRDCVRAAFKKSDKCAALDFVPYHSYNSQRASQFRPIPWRR